MVDDRSISEESPVPLVSVVVTAYKSERTLGKTIESIVAQRTNFPIELLVADDCSPDGTVALARSYQEKYPDMIRVLAREKNVGTQRNYYDAFEASRGKYIAWLDSDDYWTDPDKLMVQVAVMEEDPTISMCGHFVRWVTQEGEVIRERYPEMPGGRCGMAEILQKNFMPSPAILFRNGLQRDLPQWFFDVPPLTDWPLHVIAALKGDFYMVDRVMADYTLNATSAFWGQGDLFWYEMNADFFERIESILPAKWHRDVRARKGLEYESISYFQRKRGEFVKSRQAALKSFFAPTLMDNLGSKTKTLAAAVVREMEWRLRGRPSAAK